MNVKELTPMPGCAALFDWTPTHSTVTYRPLRITFDVPEFGYLAVLRPHHDEEQGCIWCDWVMLAVAATDPDGTMWFSSMKKFSEVAAEDLEADGFCKWDGCREIHNGTHVCDDDGFDKYLQALRVTVGLASQAAGYEGDEK